MFFFLALLAALLPACTNHNRSPADTITTVLTAPVATLNPLYATDAGSQRINELTHASLTTIGPTLTAVPYLAQEVRTLNPQTIEFRLREGCRFVSGRPINSAAVESSLAFFQNPANQSAFAEAFGVIARFEAIDTLRFRLHLSRPSPALLTDLELLKIMDLAELAPGTKPSLISGAGPMKVVHFDPALISLEASGQPCLPAPASPKIRVKVVRDDLSRFLKLKTGEVDVVLNEMGFRKVEALLKDPEPPLHVLQGDGISYTYLGLSLANPQLRDPRVRRALALSLDPEAIIRYKNRGFGARARNLLADHNFFANRAVPLVERDLPAARRLLAEAGYGPERPLRLTLKTTTSSIIVEVARVLVAQAAEAGIELRHQPLEWGVFYSDVKAGNADLYQLRWVGVTDPRIYFENFHSSQIGRGNRTRYHRPDLDRLLEEGEREMSPVARKAIYAQVQSMVAAELPYIGLYHNKNVMVYRPELKGAALSPTGSWKALLQMRKE